MRLLSREDLAAKGISLNKATIWRKLKAGEFPRPVKVGNRLAWVETEIDDYIKTLIAARDVEAA
ncbi:MAG TPA: AlpA family phage regulatory protein [Bradyrhizobium sp.]|jgi:prophage regulatory protein|uniref:helix-turn-helix transcriptional regulator n=1 Tax=Bradyrhizobium sp. TaxID=376 RepID=UPI002B907992|nr:AlpA family phage regulatory protein [Bradyrhizobium sp.]HXB77795.1 AlpA family phage regulatory protein [Bradyrhizobium sp.]